MLNEDKIRLMTKAAVFEAGEGKKALAMNKYFRGDYISINLIASWISYTIAFAIGVAAWAFYHMEDLMENINTMDLPALGKHFVFLYLGLLAVYQVINYVIYHIRYQKNRKIFTRWNPKAAAVILQEEQKKNDNLTGNKRKDETVYGEI